MAIRVATDTPERVIKVGVGADPSAIAITPNGKTAYVALLSDDEVLPVSTATNKPGKPIKVGSGPAALVITPNGKTVYAANWFSDTVTPISTATDKPAKPIKVDVSAGVIGITPNGKTVYAGAGDIISLPSATPLNAVIPISTATNQPAKTILVAPGVPFAGADAFAFTRDSKTAYAAVGGTSQVDPIRVATGTLGRAIPAGASPGAIVITPDGKTAYVADYGAPTVSSFSTATNKPGKTITVGATLSPYASTVAIALTPDGKTLYVGTESFAAGVDDWVTPVSTATDKPGKPITVGQGVDDIAITPNGTTAYVASESGVTPVRVATNTAGKTIGPGTDLAPVTMAITPNGQTVYAATAATCAPSMPPGTRTVTRETWTHWPAIGLLSRSPSATHRSLSGLGRKTYRSMTDLRRYGRQARALCHVMYRGQTVVRMTGPSSVTATVCSLCAARLPSAVRIVQPSSSR